MVSNTTETVQDQEIVPLPFLLTSVFKLNISTIWCDPDHTLMEVVRWEVWSCNLYLVRAGA